MIPNLFIVGAAKSGTTSLYSYLKNHPEIYLSTVKEPHYFCTDFHRSSDAFHGTENNFPIRTHQAYLELFSGAKAEMAIGEASASYLYSTEAAENIAAFNPAAKIIICLRSPAELVRSWHSYLLFCLEEDIEIFSKALDAEICRRDNSSTREHLPTNVRYPERLYYSSVAKLAEQVERYLVKFPRDQVFFVVLEDMKLNPQRVYSELLDFLEVSPHTYNDFEIRNARSIRKNRGITFLQRELLMPLVKSPKPKFLSRMLPEPAKKMAYSMLEKLYLALDRLNRSDDAKYGASRPEEAALKQLHASLKSEVDKLALLTGRDDLLELWAYDE